MAAFTRRYRHRVSLALLLLTVVAARAPGQVPPDEAKREGKTAAYYLPPSHVPNYFQGMDVISVPAAGDPADFWPDQLLDQKKVRPARVISDRVSSESEILGRNTWMMWCGGNEGFWDWLSTKGHGTFDFIKLIDTRHRTTRWRDVGLVSEPGMRESLVADRYGLWLDVPEDAGYAAFRESAVTELVKQIDNPQPPSTQPSAGYYAAPYDPKYPPPHVYGLSSGVLGLRLFPNPNFVGKAREKWDAKRYYDDPSYYGDPNLVRPFRVGMSCAFCHASAHPLRSPLNPERPRWDNVSASIGSQYFRMRVVFGNLLKPDNFIYHVLDSQPPGTIDTSLVATDNVNNPNTMNAIFGVPQRVAKSFENPREKLAPAAAAMPSLWVDPAAAPQAFKDLLGDKLVHSNENPRYVPRVLLPGEDSVGALTALARVYLNIGTYWEQWTRLHEPLVGFVAPKANTPAENADHRVQLPFKIADCDANSVYWQATKQRVEAVRDYFLKVTPTMPLLDATGDDAGKMRVDATKLARGRKVFAQNCIVCHSSVQPESGVKFVDSPEMLAAHPELIPARAAAAKARKAAIAQWEGTGEAWDHDAGQWLRGKDYETWALDAIEHPEFWQQNFLSSDFRVPVTYVGTNSARSMATNATDGHMWEDFASDTFRSLPSVGAISYYNPFTKQDETYTPRHRNLGNAPAGGGGPGYYRPASLMSVWATAPLLHNNSLGHFSDDPSLSGRLAAFDDAIHMLLYLERRTGNTDHATTAQLTSDHGLIWRTPTETYLQIRGTEVPQFLRRMPLPDWLFHVSESLTDLLGGWKAAPSIVLFVAAFAVLFFLRRGTRLSRFLRFGAYGLILLGLAVGFLIYLDGGGFGDLRIGPIPAGTPVNLLANLNPEVPKAQLKAALKATVDGLTEIETRHLTGEERDKVFARKVAPALLSVSKCPDLVMDKGHYFSWFAEMSGEDKEALIELLKTF